MSVLTHYPYIQKEQENKIKDFKYKGGSVSITYQYLWSPLCEFLVGKLPTTIAPNLITLTAFAGAIISHLLLIFYSPDFEQKIPTWLLILTGLTTLSYQILDNMDGKQARRTGSSTPLGMLFDHGLDSVTTWIFGINQCICVGYGQNTNTIILVLVNCFLSFYTSMWSQFHLGQLKLGRINAVDEGLILIWNTFFFTAYVGTEFWQQNEFMGIKLNAICLLGATLLGASEVLRFIYNTLTTKTEQTWAQKLKSQEQSLLLIITFTIVILFSPTKILNTPWSYLFLIQFGMVWSKSTLHLQIAHLGEQNDFHQWRVSFLIACFGHILNTLSSFVVEGCLIQEKTMLVIMFFYCFCMFIHTSTNVAKQMARFLNINIFNLNYQQKAKSQ